MSREGCHSGGGAAKEGTSENEVIGSGVRVWELGVSVGFEKRDFR